MKLFFILLLFLSLSLTSSAKYRQVCTVRYMASYGWSKVYTVEVTFISGYELNLATSSNRYSMYSIYAVIFWSKDQATVIKLSSYLACGFEVDKACIRNSIYDLKGRDQDDDEWKICASDYCF